MTWLFASSNSLPGTQQVKTGELFDGFDFWLIGYLHFLGLDWLSDCNVDVFSSPWIRKSSKNFFWNTDTWWFENDKQFLGLALSDWRLRGFFPVSLLFFVSVHKSCLIWESSAAKILAANTRVGPHNWVVCPGAMSLLADGAYNKNMVRAAVELGEHLPVERCNSWGWV